jgi:hypothetical protein
MTVGIGLYSRYLLYFMGISLGNYDDFISRKYIKTINIVILMSAAKKNLFFYIMDSSLRSACPQLFCGE